jgi:hypothetical protein
VEEEEKVEDWAGVWGAWAGRKVVSMFPWREKTTFLSRKVARDGPGCSGKM